MIRLIQGLLPDLSIPVILADTLDPLCFAAVLCMAVRLASKESPVLQNIPTNLISSSIFVQGLGEMPLDTPSAKGRRSHTGSVGHSRSSSTSRDALNVTDR